VVLPPARHSAGTFPYLRRAGQTCAAAYCRRLLGATEGAPEGRDQLEGRLEHLLQEEGEPSVELLAGLGR
jgi:hypothetical protein